MPVLTLSPFHVAVVLNWLKLAQNLSQDVKIVTSLRWLLGDEQVRANACVQKVDAAARADIPTHDLRKTHN